MRSRSLGSRRQRAATAHLHHDHAGAEIEVKTCNGVGISQARQMLRVVEARQGDVASPHRLVNDRPRAAQRPQLQPQIRVIGDQPLGVVRDVDRGERGVSGGRRDGLADAGNVQDLGLANAVDRQIGFADPARSRPGAHVGELVALARYG